MDVRSLAFDCPHAVRPRLRVACVRVGPRGDLAAALRTISRLRRGLLNAAERAALLRRLPRPFVRPVSLAAPADPAAPCASRAFGPPPVGRGSCLDAMA